MADGGHLADSLRTMFSSWRRYLSLLRAMNSSSRLLTGTLALTVLVRAVAPVGFVLAAGTVVSHVPRAIREGLNSDAGQDLLLALAVMAIAFGLQQFTPLLQQSIGYSLGNKVNLAFEQRLMRTVLSPPGIAHLEDPQLQNEIMAATHGLSGWPRPADAANALAARISTLISFAGASLLLFLFHWWVAILVMILGLLLLAQITKSIGTAAQAQVGLAAALRRSVYFRQLALTPPAAKEIRVFGLGGWLIDRYGESFQTALTALSAERARGRRTLFVFTMLMCAVVAASFVLLGWEAGTGRLDLATIAITIQALAIAGRVISDEQAARDGIMLNFSMNSLETVRAAEERLAKVPLELSGERTPQGMPKEEIRFESVSFRYPGQNTDVLSDLNLAIPTGRSLAIVGLNGAGKTTLMKLLCRLYEPTEGRITVDGVDLREVDPVAWQHRIAAIFQDFVRYPLSAQDNVQFGGLHRSHDESLLTEVSKKVMAGELIGNLPDGWRTPLSREYQGGVDLSGGEWQRIALARALFAAAAGASVLILDEPTASLDVRAEAEIYDQFLELTSGLTTFLISHRFSTVRRAERICVLEEGRIVEEGDHESLMSDRGRYAELFNLQASRFSEEKAEAGSETE